MERRPVIIVGSGPAGTATAIALHRRDPGLARDVLILEKARHPRPKVCAGGLIPAGRRVDGRARRAAAGAARHRPPRPGGHADSHRRPRRPEPLLRHPPQRARRRARRRGAGARHRDPRRGAGAGAGARRRRHPRRRPARHLAHAAADRRRRRRQPGAAAPGRRRADAHRPRRHGRRGDRPHALGWLRARPLRLRLPHPAPRPARLSLGLSLPHRRRAARQRRRLRGHAVGHRARRGAERLPGRARRRRRRAASPFPSTGTSRGRASPPTAPGWSATPPASIR